MAVTTSLARRSVFGDQRVAYLDVTGPASYSAGGDAFTVADTDGVLSQSIDLFVSESVGGLVLEYDRANDKVKCLVQGFDTDAAGAGTLDDLPVTAGTGVSTVSVGLTDPDPRFGGLVEVPDTTDLDGVTWRVMVIGT